MADNASMDDDSLRVANRIRESSGEGRGMNVTQGGIFKERGGKKEKKDEENIDEYEEEDEDEEEDDGTISSTHSPFLSCLSLPVLSPLLKNTLYIPHCSISPAKSGVPHAWRLVQESCLSRYTPCCIRTLEALLI